MPGLPFDAQGGDSAEFGELSQTDAECCKVWEMMTGTAGYCGELVLNQGAFSPYNVKEHIL